MCTDFLMPSVFLIKSAQLFFSFPQECTYFCCPAAPKFRVPGSGFPVLACAGGDVWGEGGGRFIPSESLGSVAPGNRLEGPGSGLRQLRSGSAAATGPVQGQCLMQRRVPPPKQRSVPVSGPAALPSARRRRVDRRRRHCAGHPAVLLPRQPVPVVVAAQGAS